MTPSLRDTVDRAVDTLLDRAIVPGWSRIGWDVRRSALGAVWPADASPDSLRGRVVAVTGANSGLGRATVAGAARLGATVVMLCRDSERGERARRELLGDELAGVDAELVVRRCDVSDPASVRRAAMRLRGEHPVLHGLVHNAGVMPPQRTENADGHELTLATHVLGPHLLTALLRDPLAADGDARVVFVSSGGMYARRLRVDDIEYRQGRYGGTAAYARSKRMQVVLSQLWARRLADTRNPGHGIAVQAMHPGWADTPGVTDAMPGFGRVMGPILRTAAEGADTVVYLLAAPAGGERTGLFWQDRRARPTDYFPWTRADPADARTLWDYCVEATGEPSG